MRFLTQAALRLTITRRQRKAVFNHISEVTTIYETVTRIEVTLPSFVRGIRDLMNRMADGLVAMFLPKVYAL